MSQIDAGRNSGLREVTTPLPPWKEERRKSLRREPKADYEIAAGRLLRHPARRVERHFCYEGNEPKRDGSLGKISGRNLVLPLDIPFRTAPAHVLGRMCQNDRFHTSKPTIFRFVYRVTCARRAMAGVGREAGRQRRPRRGRTALGSRMPLEYIV